MERAEDSGRPGSQAAAGGRDRALASAFSTLGGYNRRPAVKSSVLCLSFALLLLAGCSERGVGGPVRRPAACPALAVHGDTDGTVSRERVIEAYRRFIRARPAMAGFVAPELAEWQAWEATGDYAALIAADAVPDPAEEFAILTYLRQSPDPAAKAALADD